MRLLIATFLLICFSLAAHGQKGDKVLPHGEDQWKEMEVRIEKITAELSNGLQPTWAGEYIWGHIGFSGARLPVAKDSGFVYQPYTHYTPNNIVGLYDYGTVEQRGNSIYLRSTRHNFGDEEFYFMKWGDRDQLIPFSYLPILANMANSGCEELQKTNSVVTLRLPTKRSQLRAKIFGIPVVPSQFDSLFLKMAVSGKVIRISKTTIVNPAPDYPKYSWRHKYTDVRIDIGSRDGLWKGMTLYVKERTNALITAQVTNVSDNSADVKILQPYEPTTYQGKEPSGPQLAWVLTSKIDKEWYYGDSPQVCW